MSENPKYVIIDNEDKLDAWTRYKFLIDKMPDTEDGKKLIIRLNTIQANLNINEDDKNKLESEFSKLTNSDIFNIKKQLEEDGLMKIPNNSGDYITDIGNVTDYLNSEYEEEKGKNKVPPPPSEPQPQQLGLGKSPPQLRPGIKRLRPPRRSGIIQIGDSDDGVQGTDENTIEYVINMLKYLNKQNFEGASDELFEILRTLNSLIAEMVNSGKYKELNIEKEFLNVIEDTLEYEMEIIKVDDGGKITFDYTELQNLLKVLLSELRIIENSNTSSFGKRRRSNKTTKRRRSNKTTKRRSIKRVNSLKTRRSKRRSTKRRSVKRVKARRSKRRSNGHLKIKKEKAKSVESRKKRRSVRKIK
jgi:hypothetical protein